MLSETKKFYQDLFSEKTMSSETESIVYLNETKHTKLSKNEATEMEGNMSFEEASHTIKNISNFKSPGPDGFPADFLNASGKN